ncbi:MAG: hypothetical protein M1837_004199 [Sclerophora amabilis]|nr:MAG: hypothetical protein M1837_004199 [Sclerophora amabilis]
MSADPQSSPPEARPPRYRSVKDARTKPPSHSSPHAQDASVSPPNGSIARSMSRYRRARPPTAAATRQQSPPPDLPPQQTPRSQHESPFRTSTNSPITPASRHRAHSSSHAPTPISSTPRESKTPERRPRRDSRGRRDTGDHDRVHSGDAAAREQRHLEEQSARRNEEQRNLRQKQQEENAWEDKLKQIKRQELERLERELSAAKPSPQASQTKPGKDRLGFFSRMRHGKATAAMTSGTHQHHATPQGKPEVSRGIEPGGGGIVPGIDAPISAVNAGERRVKIKYNDNFINLAVLPETTSTDLIYSAAGDLGEPIQPEASVLLESFTQLGLERPIRRYEHVRDILNCWDRDTQNGLILVPSTELTDDQALEANYVPTEPPQVSIYLYYSQSPRKWDKRWVTLRSDGQMVVAKKLEAKEKDVSNVCHLSDFDIYNPTRRQMSKVIKPPKKTCFAIKSQQKSSMFLSTANFVHFFATSDKMHATQFYRAVQSWRSWYLVHKKGEGQRPTTTSDPPNPSGRPRQVSDSMGGSAALRNGSIDSVRHRRGSLKAPLTSAPPQSQKQDDPSATYRRQASSPENHASAKALHTRNMSARERRAPPVSFPDRFTKERSDSNSQHSDTGDRLLQASSSEEHDAATFSPTGLLGRTYSQRQKAHQEAARASQSDGPFTDGPNLLNGERDLSPPAHTSRTGETQQRLGRNGSVRSTKNTPTSDLNRTSSQRQKPKPLLDFSNPEYREPPQHVKRGRAHVPTKIPPGGGLIDAATSPEVAIVIPPSTSWRAQPQHHHQHHHDPSSDSSTPRTKSAERTKTLTARSHPGRRAEPQDPFLDSATRHQQQDDDEIDAFTGLLAKLDTSQGGTGTGRGVRTGDRRTKGPPMLDMHEKSRFAPGSLLSQVERREPSEGPIIDREKKKEVSVGVGEGA